MGLLARRSSIETAIPNPFPVPGRPETYIGKDTVRTHTTSKTTSAATARQSMTMSQRGVYHVLKHYGPMPDSMLVAIYAEAIKLLNRGARYPQQTPSGLRTRRAELTRKGYVLARPDKIGGKRVWEAL